MPEITGVLETALYVDDLERAGRFYTELFGFETLLADARMQALSVAGRQVLLLFRRGASAQPNPTPGGVIPAHDGSGPLHMAYAIATEDLERWERELAARQITIEAKLRMSRGGTSLYFRDPDGHLIELATPGVWPIY